MGRDRGNQSSDFTVMAVIADTTLISKLLFGERDGKCQKLKEMIVSGKIILRVPDSVRHEIFEEIIKQRIKTELLRRLLSLVTQFLDCITVDMNVEQLSKAIKLCDELDIDLTAAYCLVLTSQFGEVYVTADMSIANKLKKRGYPVLHIKELFSI